MAACHHLSFHVSVSAIDNPIHKVTNLPAIQVCADGALPCFPARGIVPIDAVPCLSQTFDVLEAGATLNSFYVKRHNARDLQTSIRKGITHQRQSHCSRHGLRIYSPFTLQDSGLIIYY
ncbi:hypothetical protein FA13DRAFT_1301072 [Coprinellus micaceus]|uniref:Uncharacterized protein n=1 Tax=Coprinellus micaceus TaxID=71717 RepID=A0A4Y7R679_COPMI|nr:hypothetical protein FA13DRAFT_1301072 [Coprinellus micaceus]